MPLVSFAWVAASDPLDEHTLAAVAAGVSTRRYASRVGGRRESRTVNGGIEQRWYVSIT